MARWPAAAAAAVVFFATLVSLTRSENGHSHSAADGRHQHEHDHGHDTRSMYYTPDPEAENEHAHEQKDGSETAPHTHSHGTSGDDSDGHAHEHAKSKIDPLDAYITDVLGVSDPRSLIWIKAIGGTFIICCAPAFMLALFPGLDDPEASRPLLKVLLSFAAGGLLGDALLHLIPHALNPHDHTGHDHTGHDHSGHDHGHTASDDTHGHDHTKEMVVGLWTLGGILAFMIIEKLMRNIKGDGGHSHGQPQNNKSGGDAKKKSPPPPSPPRDIKVAGYLNLAADFAHNFTDGLTLGAVFLHPESAPWMTFLAILLHEVPHEIGDFAILIQSGCTRWEAIRLQLVTAVGAMLGTIVGLLSENIGQEASSWILPFTAGGFIYIATVGVIPELLEDSGLWQSVKEVVAFIAGVSTMVFIMFFE